MCLSTAGEDIDLIDFPRNMVALNCRRLFRDDRKSVIKDVNFATIFKGVLPFIITDLVRLIILIAFPIIALYLPTRM